MAFIIGLPRNRRVTATTGAQLVGRPLAALPAAARTPLLSSPPPPGSQRAVTVACATLRSPCLPAPRRLAAHRRSRRSSDPIPTPTRPLSRTYRRHSFPAASGSPAAPLAAAAAAPTSLCPPLMPRIEPFRPLAEMADSGRYDRCGAGVVGRSGA